MLIERTAAWRPAGFYVVCEHPQGQYLVEDPIWIAHVLDLAAALRLQGAEVTAIASGTWMNVRSFPPDKFMMDDEEETRQRAPWYYCAEALSEYKLPFMDLALRQGVLDLMAPDPALGSQYAAALFSGQEPSTVGFNEREAFRHYLTCLRRQCQTAVADSFDDTVRRHDDLLTRAEARLQALTAARVRGQGREFISAIDASRGGLALFEATRGPILRRRWSQL